MTTTTSKAEERRDALRRQARVEPIKTEEELILTASEGARLALQRDALIIARDEKLNAMREAFDLDIELLDRELGVKEKQLKNWAVANRDERFDGKKGIRIAGHLLEFRESPGKVEFSPGMKAADIIEAILALPEENDEIVRLVVELKETLSKTNVAKLWKRDDETRELLQSIGIHVVKPEEFNFKPQREEL